VVGRPGWLDEATLRRIDMHVHTAASFDSDSEPEAVFRRCRRLGLDPVFVTDHDTLDAALRLREAHPGSVVVGQEVTTTVGEVIGLFLESSIPRGLDPLAAVGEIKAQGGLVYLEHPTDRSRRSLSTESIEQIADSIDVVEVHNSRSGSLANKQAEDLCAVLGSAAGAGSDAHRVEEIGSVYVELPDFNSPAGLLTALRHGRIVRAPNRAVMTARGLLMTTIGRR